MGRMSCILYYSNYCQSCSELLQRIGKSKIKEDLHFINLDNRVKKNSAMYVVLENGQEVLLPPTITKVPALLLLNRGHQVIFGSDIIKQRGNPIEWRTFSLYVRCIRIWCSL